MKSEMTGGLNRGPKAPEKALDSNSGSSPCQHSQQKDVTVSGVASNNDNKPPASTNRAPGFKKTFIFTSTQAAHIDFEYQLKPAAPNSDTNKKTKVMSDDKTETKIQPPASGVTNPSPQTAPGVNIALENTILLDDDYTVPRGPKSPGYANTASKTLKIPVPPSKKGVKFVMPYREDSTPSSFDNVGGPSGEGLRTKSHTTAVKRKKKAGSGPINQANKSKECALTPAALVELDQLKLRVTKREEQLNTIEPQLLEISQAIRKLQAKLEAVELETSNLRKDVQKLKEDQALSFDDSDTDDGDRLWQILGKVQQVLQVLIFVMVVYLVVGSWVI
ncbi:hypothetical protein TWF481_009107 [Arthrobotrys musiformis]|uniref:Uncharacterized protein n=1 Tax=Arthrobotrys musiformis TaxID=47236 RepID=A0AAV9W2U7_9PEZI